VSVVTRQARRRWAVVVAAVTAVALLPGAVSLVADRLTAAAPGSAPAAELVRRVLASASVPHSGLARSRGVLGLPQLPRLEDVASQLGSATTSRVWWAGPDAWRVDVLSSTGEQDSYGGPAGLTQWDYDEYRLSDVTAADVRLRLPRADDLLPPQIARRLLAGLGPADRVEPLPGRRRIAGMTAEGVRVVPGDPRTSIGRLDVWFDTGHGLPVAVTVVDAHGAVALDSQFLELSFAPPSDALLRPPAAVGADRDSAAQLDLLSRLGQGRRRRLPAELAGLPAAPPLVPGVRTWGSGLTQLTVVPISAHLAEQSLEAARRSGSSPLTVPGGSVLLAAQGVLALGVLRTADGGRAYLVAGSVVPDVLLAASRELLAPPAPQPAAATPGRAS